MIAPIFALWCCSLKLHAHAWRRKSTFFNVLTKSEVPAENFPFCTKDPNESRVAVPDTRYDWLCEHWKPARCGRMVDAQETC